VNRRLALRLLVLACCIAGLAGCSNDTMEAPKLEFTNLLNIPPLLEPTIDQEGRKHFTITMQSGATEFFEGVETPTWGVNGSYLGPTVRVSRGDRVSFEVINRLDEASTLHWHGMRLPAAMDGGPHQMIEAGASWKPYWTIEQPAATTWYHPHLHEKTALHVYRGVAGLFLIEDEESRKLPSEYGVNDIPIVIQDKKFKSDGAFNENVTQAPFGILGNQILINGTHDPHWKVASNRIRFRLLNGSNTRVYKIGFSDNRTFELIANDAGLLPEPVSIDRLVVSPGERAEIVVEFEPGEETLLRSFPVKRDGITHSDFDLVKLIADRSLAPAPPLPRRLSAEPPIDAQHRETVRTFDFTTKSEINGKAMDMHRIDHVIPAGAREIWVIRNRGWDHNFHIHDAVFTILDRNGSPPSAYERGRKDTVFIPSGTTVKIAVDFGRYADPDTPYMYHCHLLYHEDSGMMGQFVIVEPGTENRVPRRLPDRGEAGHDHSS